MKKVFILLLSILFLATGCDKTFYLDDEYYENNELIEIDSEGIKKLEEDKKSFLVFVNLSGCLSCAEFRVVLDDFMKEYNLTVYSLSITDIEGTCIDNCVKYTPSVVLYHDGKVVDYLDANSNDDLTYYESVDGFVSWLNKYVKLK